MSGGRPWSDDDTDALLELAGTVSLAAIAVRLGRTRDACAMKLQKSHTGARSARGELTGAACAALRPATGPSYFGGRLVPRRANRTPHAPAAPTPAQRRFGRDRDAGFRKKDRNG